MTNYTDTLINLTEEVIPLRNNFVAIEEIPTWRWKYMAENWKCPTNDRTRAILSAQDWELERTCFLNNLDTCTIENTADIISTSHSKKFGNTSYLIWLVFKTADGAEHMLDVWMPESGKSARNVVKHIDDRSPTCQSVLDQILNSGQIDLSTARLLPDIGSITWEGTTETRVQKKLNSYIQTKIFMDTVQELSEKLNLDISVHQLDAFDDFLYKGDPGSLADIDLTINGQTERVDLKLLKDLDTLTSQKAHDATMLIGSNWKTANVTYLRLTGDPTIENTSTFKLLLNTFKKNLIKAGACFIHIDKIDLNTGKVDFSKFGNGSNLNKQ